MALRPRRFPVPAHAGSLAAVLCAVLASAGCTAGDGTGTTLTAAPAPTSTVTLTTIADPPPPDPVTRWVAAATTLKAARSATYTVTGSYGMDGVGSTLDRDFRVDAARQVLQVDFDARNQDSDGSSHHVSGRLVVTPRGGVVQRPRGSGGWRKATSHDLTLVGVDARARITGLPSMLESFEATSDLGLGEISGSLDVREAFDVTGLGFLLADDAELRDSIGGTLYTKMTFADDGALDTVDVDGSDSTVGDVTVGGSSKQLPEEQLLSILTFTKGHLVVTGIDRPVDIELPPPLRAT